jgi:2-phosphosulfolactate phosphatase
LLGGERNGIRISANGIVFDLGNSPREYTSEKVRGETIVSTTTNGTRALRACLNAKTVLAASFLNLTATAAFLRRKHFETIFLVCAGTGENQADEDVLAAGALCDLLFDEPLTPALSSLGRGEGVNDSTQVAWEAWLVAKPDLLGAVRNAENARRLLAIPELREDVAFCLQRDICPLVAKMDASGIIRVSV